MSDRSPFKAWWGTPLVGLLGGYLASQIGWPLPWMVGSLLAIILVRCLTPWQLAEIPGGRKCGQWIVGIGLGCHFNRQFFRRAPSFMGRTLIGTVLTMLIATAAALGLSALTHLDLRSLTPGHDARRDC